MPTCSQNTHVQAGLDEEGLLGLIRLLATGKVGSLLLKASLLLLLGLALVLVKKAEKLGGSVLVENLGELGDGGRALEALVEDDLLALKANVLRPLDEAGEVGSVTDALACQHREQSATDNTSKTRVHTNTEVLGRLLEERVLLDSRGLGSRVGGGGGLLSGLDVGLRLLTVGANGRSRGAQSRSNVE